MNGQFAPVPTLEHYPSFQVGLWPTRPGFSHGPIWTGGGVEARVPAVHADPHAALSHRRLRLRLRPLAGRGPCSGSKRCKGHDLVAGRDSEGRKVVGQQGSEEERRAATGLVRDEELVNISVRELNAKLQVPTQLPPPPSYTGSRFQGCDRRFVTAMKQKRRTLKNRGYAFNCRVRRLQTQIQLEVPFPAPPLPCPPVPPFPSQAENVMLRNEVAQLKGLLADKGARLPAHHHHPHPHQHQQQQQQLHPVFDHMHQATLHPPHS